MSVIAYTITVSGSPSALLPAQFEHGPAGRRCAAEIEGEVAHGRGSARVEGDGEALRRSAGRRSAPAHRGVGVRLG
ncbi:hypothetical protein [Micromonospora avicenniae]|uniref:hypothetical protein n=1 Tax=Micromonospora avicenniae TaxID=1198245 RepID=UPI00332B6DA8